MTSIEAYENFLIKSNRNDINANVNVSKGKFVLIYNVEKDKWLKSKLKSKLSLEEIDELSELFVDNYELKRISKHLNHIDFELPSDFYSFVNAFADASKGACEKILDIWPVKPHDVPILLRDSNYKPSFEYEESILSIANKKVKVFYDGFKLKNIYFNYYRFPAAIDIEGYIKLDGSNSTSINPDLSDLYVNEIIDRCVADIFRNTENTESFAMAKERIISQEQ